MYLPVVVPLSSPLLCAQAERKLSSGASPLVFKSGVEQQQQLQLESMQRSSLATLRAAVKCTEQDMFSDEFGEKDLVSFIYRCTCVSTSEMKHFSAKLIATHA